MVEYSRREREGVILELALPILSYPGTGYGRIVLNKADRTVLNKDDVYF